MTICRYCQRRIICTGEGYWIDPEATGDDDIWRECCDANETSILADHEPVTV